MIGVAKRFNKELHRGNDPRSRQVVKEYLRKQGIIVDDNVDKYGIDLISPDNTLQIELEHRLPWVDDEFPYEEVNVPERKAKFLKDGKVQYIILSRDFSSLGIIMGKDIRPFIVDDNLVVNPNKYVRNDEYFFKIPSKLFKWIKI